MTETKNYHHGNLRKSLLSASLDLIRRHGPRGFTLREVARMAGVSHTAPYRHFRDRDDLLAAVAQDGFERLSARLDGSGRTFKAPLDRLMAAGLAYVEFALDQPEHFQVMFSTELNPELHPSASEAAAAAFERLLTVVRECGNSRVIRPGDPVLTARIAWTHVHGIADLAVRKRLGFTTRAELSEFAAVAMRTLLDGIVAR